MIIGIGVDVCPVARMSAAAARPGFLDKVFASGERDASAHTLAGRFAAKEALAKALGAPLGLRWHDCEVRRAQDGAPLFVCTGTVAQRMRELGVVRAHLSVSHDAGLAVAMVVCEG